MPLLFDIDAHGRLVPHSDEARRALADRAGRFLLLPSVGDLLVARRAPAIGGAAPSPRCTVAGDLGGLPIVDFLGFVQHARLSGTLTVSADGVERSIVFKDGEVRGAASTAPGERLGEVALRLGLASEAQLGRAAASGRPLVRALEEEGGLSANDVWRCLHEQLTTVFHGILLSPAGTFALVDEDPAERSPAPLSVSTQSLLMEGLRRIDELSLFKARIPGPHAFLKRRPPPRPVTLRPTEHELLALVDGRRTVAEVATAARLSEFDATKALFHLAEAGYLEAVDEAGASGDPAERIGAILSGANGLLRDVAAAVPATARGAFLAASRAFLSDPANPFAALLGGVALADDGGLDEAALAARLAALERRTLGQLDGSADRPRVLLQAMREALFFWLFAAGERLDRGADEALGRALKPKLARLEALA
jgi:uncharacterized protein DUF4388